MIGIVQSFDEDLVAKYVECLVEADEVERALLVLDNVPAYYRDNPPLKLQKLRQDIIGGMITAHAYLNSNLDDKVRPETCSQLIQNLLRGILVQREVSRYNKRGLCPHIVDVGPGEYFVPIGLQQAAHNFTYWDIGLDQKTRETAHEIIIAQRQEKPRPDQPIIFLALEVIEHLSQPRELSVELMRHCGRWPDRIHLSTPYYTYDGGKKDWRKPCGLPHLRAYTPKEFMKAAEDIFPGYNWELFPSQVMSLRGSRLDKLDGEPIYRPE